MSNGSFLDFFNSTVIDVLESKMVDDEIPVSLHGNTVAVIIIFMVGTLGLIANICSLFLIIKIPALHNCFGYLCFIHALGEAGILAIFVFWSTLLAIIKSDLSHTLLGLKMGQFMLICWYITLYAQFLKALNRFFAIRNPVYYQSLFKNSNGKYFFGIVVAFSLCHGIVYFFDGCNFYFESTTLIWTYEDSPCGYIISFYADFIFSSILMLIIIFIDSCTIYTINYNRRTLKLGRTNQKNPEAREIRFFIQTCLTSVLYSVMIASFHLVWRIDSRPWPGFLSTSAAWELCHALDAALMIAFNAKLRNPTTTSTINTWSSRNLPFIPIIF